MEILHTIVEIPDIELPTVISKISLTGTQQPLISLLRLNETDYKLAIIFITKIEDQLSFECEVDINVLIYLRYTGPPIQPSDLYSLYSLASIGAKKKMTESKVFNTVKFADIGWQQSSLHLVENILQNAIKKMNART